MHKLTVTLTTLLLCASAAQAAKWGPTWSELTGASYHSTVVNKRPALISSVDGRSYTTRIIKIEPGPHAIVVQSPRHKGFRGGIKTMQLDVEPCKRYYLNAQFASSVGPEWEPVVDHVERIAGCKIAAAAT